MIGPSIPRGGVKVTVYLGTEKVTQQCRVLDTDAFDIVIGTHFLCRNPWVKMVSLQYPMPCTASSAVAFSLSLLSCHNERNPGYPS